MSFDSSLWVTVDVVLRYLSYYRSQVSYNVDLAVYGLVRAVDPAPSLSESFLAMVVMESHFYVLLYDAAKGVAFGCDSLNVIVRKKACARLASYMDCVIVPVRFVGAVGVDHCGAGAVVIGLEFLRQFKRDELDRSVVFAPKGRLVRLISLMYRGRSRPARGWTSIDCQAKVHCRFCDYTHWSKRSVLMHERHHVRNK